MPLYHSPFCLIDRFACGFKSGCPSGLLAVGVDLPGYGQSSPALGSPRSWLRVLLKLLTIEKPMVVSPSLSGRYSLPLVTRTPELAVWGENDTLIPQCRPDRRSSGAGRSRLLTESQERGRYARRSR
jgi:hypothetical protein